MTRSKKTIMSKKTISLFIVGIFLISAMASLLILPEGSGNVTTDDQPLANPRLSGTIDFNDGDKADQLFEGTAQYSYMGSSLTSGDLDGDGYDDYIVGSQGASSNNGEVYIYFGIKNVHPINDPDNANITLSGTSSRGYFGMSVQVGDFNGDGMDDLLVGADGANTYKGEAYLFFGKTTWAKKATIKATSADVIFKGEAGGYYNYAYFGSYLTSGDLDGDGYDEVIVNAPYYTEDQVGRNYAVWGRTYIWWGRASWNSQYDTEKGEYDSAISGKQVDSSMYFYVYGSLGYGKPNTADMNGDGADDLIVGGYYEIYFPSSNPSSYTTYCGGVHILEGTLGDRSKWDTVMTIADLAEDDPDLPVHHWLYSGKSSDYFGGYVYGADMNGDDNMDLVVSKGTSSGSAFIFWGNGSMDRFGGGTWTTRMQYNDHPDYTTVAGPTNLHVEDFDNDGISDLYGGSYYVNSPNGGLWLWYGSSDWGQSVGANDADLTIRGGYYDYLGYYYYPCISSGDFNNDNYEDLFFGAFYHKNSQTNQQYAGGAYVILSVPPEMHLKTLDLMDGDGVDQNVLTPDAGGNRYEPTDNQIGDGVYTFKVAFNDSWTVVEAQEISIEFKLKSEYLGLVYKFAYSPVNETFFIEEGLGGGIEIVPERSEFKMFGYNDAEVIFAIRITMNFLTEDLFDVVATVSTARVFRQIQYDEWLRVEFDLTFDKDDVKVIRGEEEVMRGDFLSGGPPLVMTGIRVVYAGTDVSPSNDKYFLRVIDSYGRIFENKSSGGYDIYFEIPTNVDSGKYTLSINIIVNPIYVEKMEDLSIIPTFYLTMDFGGPESPPNLAFHADSAMDPEGRWDDDDQVWVAWDPAYDSQVGIDHYEYMIEGPDGFFLMNSTNEFMAEIQLGGDGVYTIYVWAVDKVNNPGARAIETIIKDSSELMFGGATPSYMGGQWFNSKDVNIVIKITDIVQHLDGPHIKLSTMEYAITQSMTEIARDDAGTVWKRPIYNIIQEEKDGLYYTYTISVNIPNLVEGKNNFVWFKVMDEAGNDGITTLVDTADPNYEVNATMYNPSNIWVDITSLTYTDPLPSLDEQPLEENIVTASVVINDLGAGVDASTIEYSVSRDGLTNYGGWISANINTNGNTVIAETISDLLFQPGSINYIRWRAKDVAGNGYTISEDFSITTIPREVNNPPLAVISQPEMQAVYNTKDTITFDASSSTDPDHSTLSYKWVLANKDQFGEEATFTMSASELERGIHVITLYISDGEYTVTHSISIYIKQHVDEVDTDNDGIADGADGDDDNDGLLDEEEIAKGTNPRLKDSDSDGVNDRLDEQPLNPEVGPPNEREGKYSYWDMMNLFLILGFFIILISMLVIMKRRSTMQKDHVVRNVVQEGKIMQRYEVLTGVDAPLLPQVKEMGVSLPPVAAQQVAPVKRATKLTETPNLPATAEPAPQPAPEPAPAPVDTAPEPQQEGAAAQAANCNLCGSAIDVPAGATSVECPLCGEKKDL